jgi:serine/threonine protein kinase
LLPVRVAEVALQGLDRPRIYVDLVGLPREEAKERLLAAVQAERTRQVIQPTYPARAGAMASADPMQPVGPGGRYRLVRRIGSGGMGEVWEADDVLLGRRVALKLLAPELSQDERFQQRFLRESRLAASLDHPNIIPIYDAGESSGLLYIVMRYVEGSDLKELLDREGPLDLARTTSILRQVGAALDAAHARGLVHRDVKPGNILIASGTGREEPDHVYLTDFGLTKDSPSPSEETTSGRRFIGTVDYVAPEQIGRTPVDARTDVYSLGCVLYQALTGKPPFDRNDEAALLWAHLVEHPPPVSARRPGLPPGLDAVVAKAMAKAPEDRYGACRDLVADFQDEVEGRAASREPAEREAAEREATEWQAREREAAEWQAREREREAAEREPAQRPSPAQAPPSPPVNQGPVNQAPVNRAPEYRAPSDRVDPALGRVGVRRRRLPWLRRPTLPRRERQGTVPTRYVNLWFTRQPSGRAVRRRSPLVMGQVVYLQVNIGPLDSRTLLDDAHPFPSQDELYQAFPELRGEPIPVEACVFTTDFAIPVDERSRKLTLAPVQPTEPVYFGMVPLRTGRVALRVCLFYRYHLLQSILVTASVASVGVIAMRKHAAQVEITFTADFATAGSLPPRGLWVGVNQTADASHAINVRGQHIPPLLRQLEPKIERALEQARKAMLQVSFDQERDDGNVVIDERTGEPKKVYRFDRTNRPRTADDEAARRRRFRDDLATLARAGAALHEAIFGTGAVPTAEERAEVESLRRGLQKTLQREQVIQVSRLKHMEDIWPWSVVYDLLIDPRDVEDVCLAFLGPDGRSRPYSVGAQSCSHLDRRTGLNDPTVVCPYGFWGFKHVIEQPTQPGGKQAFADLVVAINLEGDPVLNMPLAAQLLDLEDEHIQHMRDARFHVLETYRAILDAFTPTLNPPEPHALYFLCHGKYDQNGNFYLEVGEGKALPPAILDRLNFTWSRSHGIVFINGCHTVDLKPKDLSNIMAPFLKGEASGIIGSEISVHTFLAREFAQEFFNRFIPNAGLGQPVGRIIKDLRLDLLARFNPLGLVYTAYCSADLHMASSGVAATASARQVEPLRTSHPARMRQFCPYCGNKIEKDLRFCGMCGHPLE